MTALDLPGKLVMHLVAKPKLHTILVCLAGLFLWLGISASRTRESSGWPYDALTVNATRKSFGSLPSGISYTVTFNLTNHSWGQMKILGATSACHPVACLRAGGFPVVIPPGSERPVRVEILTRDEGSFLGSITLFTDCAGKPEIDVELSGNVKRGPN